MLPRVAITIGDIYGIGPEIIARLFSEPGPMDRCIPVVFGPPVAIDHYRRTLSLPVECRVVADPAAAQPGTLNIFPCGIDDFQTDSIGQLTESGGSVALDAITQAVDACMRGTVAAMVTAPLSKEALALAGSPFKGHTDMLAFLTGTAGVLMILASDAMRVGLVTVHIPLREVPSMIDEEKILRAVRLADRSLRSDFGVASPSIAVLGLNPHAGDGGVLGGEEREIIVPAIVRGRNEGFTIAGPFPSDAFFSARSRERYDLVLAMYHDQGLIPFKMHARGRGVNFTAGLPIVRTSPDHGTAYDIAGWGIAEPDSLGEALKLALAIAGQRTGDRITIYG